MKMYDNFRRRHRQPETGSLRDGSGNDAEVPSPPEGRVQVHHERRVPPRRGRGSHLQPPNAHSLHLPESHRRIEVLPRRQQRKGPRVLQAQRSNRRQIISCAPIYNKQNNQDQIIHSMYSIMY